MVKAYIGIVNSNGLELFLPETEGVACVASIGPEYSRTSQRACFSNGLESFLSETQVCPCVSGIATEPGRIWARVCFWAAVSDDVAAQIHEYLRTGHRRQALLTLDSLATEIAPLEPVRAPTSRQG